MIKYYFRVSLAVLGLAGFCSVARAQNCPSISGCPVGLQTLCDHTENDSTLWNTAPFTWSPTILSADVPEGATDLTLRVLNPCGVSPAVSFVLLLDLDADDVQETAISSAALPPPGRVLVNSAFSPTYSDGDTLWFDLRPVADSLKFKFALQVLYYGDTAVYHIRWNTLANPDVLLSARLPEGRHRIQWRVVHNGQTRSCDYAFRMRDCVPPLLTCQNAVAVAIQNNGPAVLNVAGTLINASDNVTPPGLLQFGLRRAGTGTGFPVGPGGLPYDTLRFECAEAGLLAVELWTRDRAGNATPCTTQLAVESNAVYCYVPPPPPPRVCARTFWDTTTTLSNTEFFMVWSAGNGGIDTLPLTPVDSTCAEYTATPPSSSFSLTTRRHDSALNGISTLDLVLISRHILNVAPFDEPWKMVAADVNRNGAVTAQDIVELRKLILGISTVLPGMDTLPWRFFNNDCMFGANPFAQFCPSVYTFFSQPIEVYPALSYFNALKIGDVNASVDLGGATAAAAVRTETGVFFPDHRLAAGTVVDVPLTLGEAADWLGAQFVLQYDPALLSVEAIDAGVIATPAECTAIRPDAGEVAVSWMAPGGQVAALPADAVLLRLRVRALRDVSLARVLRAGRRVRPEAYTGAGESIPLTFAGGDAAGNSPERIDGPTPNPTNGPTAFDLWLTRPAAAELTITDLAGRVVLRRTVDLEAGHTRIDVPADLLTAPGLYAWQWRAGSVSASGRLVRW